MIMKNNMYGCGNNMDEKTMIYEKKCGKVKIKKWKRGYC
jgi:hypothetical protein